MKFLDYLTSPKSLIVRSTFALILLLPLVSKIYDPSFFMEYIAIALHADSGIQLFVTILYSIIEVITIITLLFLRKEKWPFLLVFSITGVFTLSLLYVSGLDLGETAGCFGSFVQIQSITTNNIIYHGLITLSSFLIWLQQK
ncbi:MAG: MauE/DoxX family redox-associated membrane protein [Balneolaceae bacterium]